LVRRQQDTIDVIDRAGELPRKARAVDGFDLRFDQVVSEATAGTQPAGGGVPAPKGGSR
jgi:sulfonate transport system substrate-binding protein